MAESLSCSQYQAAWHGLVHSSPSCWQADIHVMHMGLHLTVFKVFFRGVHQLGWAVRLPGHGDPRALHDPSGWLPCPAAPWDWEVLPWSQYHCVPGLLKTTCVARLHTWLSDITDTLGPWDQGVQKTGSSKNSAAELHTGLFDISVDGTPGLVLGQSWG